MGGRSAEEIIFGKITTGASNDLQRATDLAEQMVGTYGMSDILGPLAYDKQGGGQFLGGNNNPRRELSDATAQAIDKEVNALPIHCFDQARDQAKSFDLDRHESNPRSLCGLPIAVKDYNDLGGAVTTYGSPIFAHNVAQISDATIRKLESNGAIAVAKSNVPEWAGGHTFNPVNGLTRNPWDMAKSAGGSSGGSAAALASGLVWLATGNDLGGSLRTPAAFNGVVGLRPSPGRVPRGTRLPSMDTLWVEGPMARNVDDLALMLDAGVGHQIDDPLSFDHSGPSFVDVLNTILDSSLPLTPPEWEEWGNPILNKNDFLNIKSYSPYDNVKKQEYPSLLVTAGLTDPRVTYWEAAKWVAKLRELKTDKNNLYLKTNMEAGHAGKAGRYHQIEEAAFMYAFILDSHNLL